MFAIGSAAGGGLRGLATAFLEQLQKALLAGLFTFPIWLRGEPEGRGIAAPGLISFLLAIVIRDDGNGDRGGQDE